MSWRLCYLALAALTLRAAGPLPRFEDYPATANFHGKPAVPKLKNVSDRMFRTQIGRVAASGPNFAGSLTIAAWGCGAACLSIAVIDAKSGALWKAPFRVLAGGFSKYADGSKTTDSDFRRLVYHRDSRLLIARGCPEEDNCGEYFYEWTGSEVRLLRQDPATPLESKP